MRRKTEILARLFPAALHRTPLHPPHFTLPLPFHLMRLSLRLLPLLLLGRAATAVTGDYASVQVTGVTLAATVGVSGTASHGGECLGQPGRLAKDAVSGKLLICHDNEFKYDVRREARHCFRSSALTPMHFPTPPVVFAPLRPARRHFSFPTAH